MLKAVFVLHSNKIIHCDIKPSNFLVFYRDKINNSANKLTSEQKEQNENNKNNISSEDSKNYHYNNYECETDIMIKLTDFGVSHVISNENTMAHAKFACGSYDYKAPELKNV
jgi:serine/threonine protein kinase